MAAFVVAVALLVSIFTVGAVFSPADNYLIDCGSTTSTNIAGRTFAADTASAWTLSAPNSATASAATNAVASLDTPALYQTARIFTSTSSYSFPIKNQGRHFLRLYLFPFSHQSYNLTAATFSISTQDIVLLTGAPTSRSAVFKEYLLSITRDTLLLTFDPSSGTSLAFVNAIELVSVPDNLIADSAQIVNPPSTYQGLSQQALETTYRINMGGPLITSGNDTLWRTWVPDQSFLRERTLATSVSFPGKINHMAGGATEEIAPDSVYCTATRLAESSNTSSAAFNVTWELGPQSPISIYLQLRMVHWRRRITPILL